MLLDFIIKDQYLTKIATLKHKVRFIKQSKAVSLVEIAETADLFDNSNAESNYIGNDQKENSFNRNEPQNRFRSANYNFQRKNFNPNGKEHMNCRTENKNNNNNNRNQGKRNNYNSYNGNHNNRSINALALDRSNRQNQKCSYCFRTNHADKDCYYKSMNTPNTNNNNNAKPYRNQNNQGQRRNEHIRYMEEQNMEAEFSQEENEGIIFNRTEEIYDNNTSNQGEVNTMQFNNQSRQHHSVCAAFVDKYIGQCEEPVGYGKVNGIAVKVVRDSGASCSFINSKLVKQENYTCENALVTLAEGSSQIRPLAKVEVDTPFFQGELTCIVSKDAKQDLLIGNYNADKKDKIGGCKYEKIYNDEQMKKDYDNRINEEGKQNQINQEILVEEENAADDIVIETENSKYIESEIQDVIMRKLLENNETENTDNEIVEVKMVTTRSMELIDKNKKGTQIKTIKGIECKPEELIVLQQDDETLKNIRSKLVDEDANIDEGGSIYFKRKGIIFRKHRGKKEFKNKLWDQVVVPQKLREPVMKLAHESPIGAHQGMTKCEARLLENFFWPGIQGDLKRFINSCEVCQRTVSKGLVPKVPMELTVLGDHVFNHIYIDLIGEIKPNSSRGHRYIM